MKTSIYILVLTVFSLQSQAQNTIITMRGDSLNGSFDITKRSGNEFVDFRNADGEKKKFRLFDIKQIITADQEVLEPIKLETRYTFGKVISKGYLSLYSFKGESSRSGFNERALVKLDGTSAVVPGAIGFRKTISRFLSDCPVLSQQIRDKKLRKDDLNKIIEEFNGCISGESNTTVETPKPVTKEIKASSEQQTQVNDFKTLLKYSDKVSNKEDVLDMFNDLNQKLINKERIPNYLKNILLESISNDDKLKKIVLSMIK